MVCWGFGGLRPPARRQAQATGFNFGNPKQTDLFDADNNSEYVSDKENWNNVSEDNSANAPLSQLPLTFAKLQDSEQLATVPDSQRTRMETTGRLDRHAGKVGTPAAAARLLSQFDNAAQENLFTIAVDKNDNIVEVHRYTKGIKAASYLDIIEMAGRILNTKGVTKVFSVHNHPSGSTEYSPNDMASHRNLDSVLNLKGIETVPLIISHGKYATFYNQPMTTSGSIGYPTPAGKGEGVPVKERSLEVFQKPGPQLSTSAQARDWFDANAPGQDGMVMLNTKGQPIGFIPYPALMQTRAGAVEFIARMEAANASSVVVNFQEPMTPQRRAFLQNIIDNLGTTNDLTKNSGTVNFFDIMEAGRSRADNLEMLKPSLPAGRVSWDNLDTSETLLSVGEKNANVQKILNELEQGHDYIEKGHPGGVQGSDGTVHRKAARTEAAEQIANLQTDRFDEHQTIVTIAEAQQWLADHRLPRVSKNHEITKNLLRLLKKRAFQELSIFDRILIPYHHNSFR